MGKQDSETPLARRLRELEEEERVLQQHVKEMTRKARRMEHLTSEPGLTRTEPRLASSVPRPGAPPVEPAAEPEPEARPAAEPRAPLAPGMAPRNPSANETQRFANYFASGSFGKARPLGRERRVMRNKAIFMLLLVALFAFVLHRLLFGS